MSKVWIGVTLLAVVAGGAAGYVMMKSRMPDLSPVGPNRDLAPDTLAVYAEFPDAAGTWSKMQGTGAGSEVTAYLGRTVAPAGTPPAQTDFSAFPGFYGGVFVG